LAETLKTVPSTGSLNESICDNTADDTRKMIAELVADLRKLGKILFKFYLLRYYYKHYVHNTNGLTKMNILKYHNGCLKKSKTNNEFKRGFT